MPTMPRPFSKATKVVYKLYGIPSNLDAFVQKNKGLFSKHRLYNEPTLSERERDTGWHGVRQ